MGCGRWGGEGAGGGTHWLQILSKHLVNASQVCVVARGQGGVGGGGGEGAEGRGHALAAFEYSLNTPKNATRCG